MEDCTSTEHASFLIPKGILYITTVLLSHEKASCLTPYQEARKQHTEVDMIQITAEDLKRSYRKRRKISETEQMEISEEAKERFRRKPYYMQGRDEKDGRG